MKHLLPFILIVSFILTSCVPAIGVQPATLTPSLTATALPTLTSSATATPKPTPTPSTTPVPTEVGPSEETLNQILETAGINYSPETTNEVLDANGNTVCTFKYSNDVLDKSQIDYIQFPQEVKDFMCMNIWAKMMMLQRLNAPFLEAEFGGYPKYGNSQTHEIQREMRESARQILDQHGSIPYSFWDPIFWDENNEPITANISGLELNHLSKEEYFKLKGEFDNKEVVYSTGQEVKFSEEQLANNFGESNLMLLFQGSKMLVYYYNYGGRMDQAEGGIENIRDFGFTTLEFLTSTDRVYKYNALIEDYIQVTHGVKMLSMPNNQLNERWEEADGMYTYDPLALYGEANSKRKSNADQTFSALYSPTPTP